MLSNWVEIARAPLVALVLARPVYVYAYIYIHMYEYIVMHIHIYAYICKKQFLCYLKVRLTGLKQFGQCGNLQLEFLIYEFHVRI